MANQMDERLNMIFARRSVREYTKEKLTESDIRNLLEAGMAAPSAGNSKPWHFVVTTETKLLERLGDCHPYGGMLKRAAGAITVCGDTSLSDYWLQDCTAATENILIAAAGIGLGAVWLGTVNSPTQEKAIREIASIPPEIRIVSLISVGYPAEKPEPRTQYDQSRVHLNPW